VAEISSVGKSPLASQVHSLFDDTSIAKRINQHAENKSSSISARENVNLSNMVHLVGEAKNFSSVNNTIEKRVTDYMTQQAKPSLESDYIMPSVLQPLRDHKDTRQEVLKDQEVEIAKAADSIIAPRSKSKDRVKRISRSKQRTPALADLEPKETKKRTKSSSVTSHSSAVKLGDLNKNLAKAKKLVARNSKSNSKERSKSAQKLNTT
jgi:hypothetical protein